MPPASALESRGNGRARRRWGRGAFSRSTWEALRPGDASLPGQRIEGRTRSRLSLARPRANQSQTGAPGPSPHHGNWPRARWSERGRRRGRAGRLSVEGAGGGGSWGSGAGLSHPAPFLQPARGTARARGSRPGLQGLGRGSLRARPGTGAAAASLRDTGDRTETGRPDPAARGLPALGPRRTVSWSGSSVRPRPWGGAALARTRPTEASGGGGWKRGQAAGKGDDSSPGARIGNTAIWEQPFLGRRAIQEESPSGEDLRPALAVPCLQPRP